MHARAVRTCRNLRLLSYPPFGVLEFTASADSEHSDIQRAHYVHCWPPGDGFRFTQLTSSEPDAIPRGVGTS